MIGGLIAFFCGFHTVFSYGRRSMLFGSLMPIVLGPVVLRLVFALPMPVIAPVRNVAQISTKTDGPTK